MRPTFSTLERAVRCPGHLALPRVVTTSAAAERGTAIHLYLEAVQNGADPEEALDQVDEDWRPLCAAIDIERLPKGLAAEVAFAYDVVTGKARELGRGIGRKYEGLTPYEVAGTADIVGVSEDAVVVMDLKTGWSELPPAAESFQLRIGALAAARVFDRDRAVVEYIRIKENGSSWRDRGELDEFDLDAFAAELRPLRVAIEKAQNQAAARGGIPDVNVGPWCRFCPSWAACPAKKALIQRAVAAARGDDSALVGPVTAAQYGAAWELAKTMQSVGRRLESQVKEDGLAEYGELPLPSGKVLREVIEEGNEQLDGRVVFAVVKDKFDADVAEQCVEVDATKAGISRALKTAAKEGIIPPRSAAKVERDLLEEVRKRGGASRPMRKKLVEVDPAQAPAVEGAGPPPSPAPLPAPAPKEAAKNDPDTKDRADVAARLERVLEEKDPAAALQLIYHRIKMGMEGEDLERWAPLLKLWGLANEEFKAQQQGAA